LLTAGATTWLPLASNHDDDEFCQDEAFTARCQGRYDVILMDTASYGRPRLGRCVHRDLGYVLNPIRKGAAAMWPRDLGYVGCATDAIRVLDSRCSGQPHGCSVSMMDRELRQLRPCPLDVTWHLQARYTCVPGQSCSLSIDSAVRRVAR